MHLKGVKKRLSFCRNNPNSIAVIKVLENPVVKLIADKHHVTPAQVLIRYWIEKGVAVIPKSCNEERIRSNGDVSIIVI